MKSKYVAAGLAFFLGVFGVHRFYLGKRFWGVAHFALFWLCFAITVDEHEPFIMLPAVLGFIDAVLLFFMPVEEFDERYNRRYLHKGSDWREPAAQPRQRRERQDRSQKLPAPLTGAAVYKKSGIEKFRDYDYEGAIYDFNKALEIKNDDQATHFNLACCYSIIEEPEQSFHHLDKAVASGFKDFQKIETHDALSYLRTQPQFEAFAANGFRQPVKVADSTPPPTQPSIFDDVEPGPDFLEQIVKLGDLRDKGILTEEEFAMQKRKILGEN